MKLKERFERKFIISESGCWEWTGSLSRLGYGNIQVNKKNMKAHRVAWMLYNGIYLKQKIMIFMERVFCINVIIANA